MDFIGNLQISEKLYVLQWIFVDAVDPHLDFPQKLAYMRPRSFFQRKTNNTVLEKGLFRLV